MTTSESKLNLILEQIVQSGRTVGEKNHKNKDNRNGRPILHLSLLHYTPPKRINVITCKFKMLVLNVFLKDEIQGKQRAAGFDDLLLNS